MPIPPSATALRSANDPTIAMFPFFSKSQHEGKKHSYGPLSAKMGAAAAGYCKVVLLT
jgi:hypothetical protein